jgi:hypothetical protein
MNSMPYKSGIYLATYFAKTSSLGEGKIKKILVGLYALTLISGLAVNAMATAISFTDLSGGGGSAKFDTSGTDLTDLVVTLTNTSNTPVLVPTDVLTAVFFTLAGNLTLDQKTSTASAVLIGSTVINSSSQPNDGVVGGEWAYKAGLVGAPGGAYAGISSAGLNLFGPHDLFPGTSFSKNPPGGLGYGIISAEGIGSNANPAIMSTPLIHNSVVFTLSGLPSGFDPSGQDSQGNSNITNVSFQYGTALPVPEPSTIILLGSGLIGLVASRKFIKTKK